MGNYAYIADFDNGLVVIDITDPTNPTFVGTDKAAGYAFGVYVLGKYAYVAHNDEGLVILSISD